MIQCGSVQECSNSYRVSCSDVSVEAESRGGMGLGHSGLKGELHRQAAEHQLSVSWALPSCSFLCIELHR